MDEHPVLQVFLYHRVHRALGFAYIPVHLTHLRQVSAAEDEHQQHQPRYEPRQQRRHQKQEAECRNKLNHSNYNRGNSLAEGFGNGTDVVHHPVEGVPAVKGLLSVPAAFHEGIEECLAQPVLDLDVRLCGNPALEGVEEYLQEQAQSHTRHSKHKAAVRITGHSVHKAFAEPDEGHRHRDVQHTRQG